MQSTVGCRDMKTKEQEAQGDKKIPVEAAEDRKMMEGYKGISGR